MELIENYIDGERRPASGGRRFPNIDPWTQEVQSEVTESDASDVDVAVRSARKAFEEGPWGRMPATERAEILHRLGDLLEANAYELAMADTRDMGNPIKLTRHASAPRAAENFRFFADQAVHQTGEYLPRPELTYVRYEAAGVVAAVAPWNFPLIQETWKAAPALAFGNTCVLKPAEDSPSSAIMIAELATEAGLPPGVLNVVQGFGANAAGQALVEHPGIDRITFTGEPGTGRAISRSAAANLTPVSLELGGKGATIVFGDADLEAAVTAAVTAAYTNAGQLCFAGSRILVEDSVYDEFCARFVAKAEALVLGDPKSDMTDVGPLASEAQFKKVSSYLDVIGAEGGKVLTGGEVVNGWLIAPTLVAELASGSRLCKEEIFGPIITVGRFSSEAEAIELANDVPFGLTSSVFTNDLSRSVRMSNALKVGTVWVNTFMVRDLRAPFGGYKASGVGREGGNFSRDFFTEQKTVITRYAQ